MLHLRLRWLWSTGDERRWEAAKRLRRRRLGAVGVVVGLVGAGVDVDWLATVAWKGLFLRW